MGGGHKGLVMDREELQINVLPYTKEGHDWRETLKNQEGGEEIK